MNYLRARSSTLMRISVPNFSSGVAANKDESVLNMAVASQCYNFDYSSGALKGCTGFTSLSIKADSVWTCTLNGQIYLMYSVGGEVYYRTSGKSEKLENIKLNGKPKAISYRLYGEDVVLICSPNDNMVVWNGFSPPYYVSSSPFITSMVMHYERMFVTTSDNVNLLRFSDDLDPTNWNTDLSEGGFIELADERGALIKVIGFLNYVYIFRERGITRLTAYADQSEFTISHLFVTSGRIYPETVALCGDKVIFASSEGLYIFDGVSTRRILKNLDGLIFPDENSVAAYHGGKYFIALKAAFKGEGFSNSYTNNAVLIYGEDVTLMRGYDVSSFYSSGDDLYAVIDDHVYTYSGKCDKPKRWTVPKTDLGTSANKMIKAMYIDSDKDITLNVDVDGCKKSFAVKGKNTVTKVNINMIGRKMGMTIDCDEQDPTISRPQLLFGVAAS